MTEARSFNFIHVFLADFFRTVYFQVSMHNGGYINQTVNTTNNQTIMTKVNTWATPPTRYANYYQNFSLPYVSALDLWAWLA